MHRSYSQCICVCVYLCVIVLTVGKSLVICHESYYPKMGRDIFPKLCDVCTVPPPTPAPAPAPAPAPSMKYFCSCSNVPFPYYPDYEATVFST